MVVQDVVNLNEESIKADTLNTVNRDLLQQLRRFIECDEIFVSSEFLRYYARLAFGHKLTEDVLKRASMMAKEFKVFISSVIRLQKDSGVTMCNLTPVEMKVIELIGKSFKLNQKVIDGDVAIDNFKLLVQKDSELSNSVNKPFIDELICSEELSTIILNLIDDKFSYRKCLFNTLSQYQVLYNFIHNGFNDVDSWDEYLNRFSAILQSSLMEVKVSKYSPSELVVMSEQSLDAVFDEEKTKFRVSTGYKIFDWAFNGGFENGRVYLFGGISGGGKSLVLINLALRCKMALGKMVQTNDPTGVEKFKGSTPAVFYITLENSREETRNRLITCGLGIGFKQLASLQLIDTNTMYKSKYDSIFKNNPAELLIKWEPPKSITVLDIISMINTYEHQYNIKIAAVFIDYADKMLSTNPSKTDQEWRDLGSITDEMKTMAVDLDIPVISVTQVNKSAYNKKDKDSGRSLNGGEVISGSIRKKENTDVLVLFNFTEREQKEITDDMLSLLMNSTDTVTNSPCSGFEEITGVIDKNRDGPSNVRFKMYIDYSKCSLSDNPNVGTIDPILASSSFRTNGMNNNSTNSFCNSKSTAIDLL